MEAGGIEPPDPDTQRLESQGVTDGSGGDISEYISKRPELGRLVARWASLPDATRDAILKLAGLADG